MLLTEKIKSFLTKDKPKLTSDVDPSRIISDLENDADANLGLFYWDSPDGKSIDRYFRYDSKFTFEENIQKQRMKILKYREMSANAEISHAINEIVNEIIYSNDNSPILQININEENKKIRDKIEEEFKAICTNINLDYNFFNIVKKSYIDGQLIILCRYGSNVADGILDFQMLDPVGFYFDKKTNTYKYDNRVSSETIYDQTNIVEEEYSPEEIVRVDFGLHSDRLNLSYLEFAVKTYNMLKTLEDLLIPLRFSRSVSRRVFNVDVGDLPFKRATEVLKSLQNEFKYKKFYNNDTGEVSNQQHITSMVEDYWFANRSGAKGTTVETLDETGNLGELNDILYFARKLYRSLNVPVSRLYIDSEADHMFDTESTSIDREDLAFFHFVTRLRRVYVRAFKEILKRQVVSKKILTLKEWDEIDPQISIEFVCENKFVENMNLNNLAKRMEIYSSIQANEGKVLPVKETLKRVFGYTESDIEKILAEIEKEKKDPKLKDFYNSDSEM